MGWWRLEYTLASFEFRDPEISLFAGRTLAVGDGAAGSLRLAIPCVTCAQLSLLLRDGRRHAPRLEISLEPRLFVFAGHVHCAAGRCSFSRVAALYSGDFTRARGPRTD